MKERNKEGRKKYSNELKRERKETNERKNRKYLTNMVTREKKQNTYLP